AQTLSRRGSSDCQHAVTRLVPAALCIAFVVGTAGASRGQNPPRRDQTIENLIADAASLPPEFEADVLLRISSMSKVDKEWRREILDTAYMRAYAAPEQN